MQPFIKIFQIKILSFSFHLKASPPTWAVLSYPFSTFPTPTTTSRLLSFRGPNFLKCKSAKVFLFISLPLSLSNIQIFLNKKLSFYSLMFKIGLRKTLRPFHIYSMLTVLILEHCIFLSSSVEQIVQSLYKCKHSVFIQYLEVVDFRVRVHLNYTKFINFQ